MMKDTKTYCFGRFLIDLPKTAEMNGQTYGFMFGKIETERFPKGGEAFVQTMKEREEALRAAAKTASKAEYKFAATHLSNRQDARIFVTSLTVYGDTATGFELYRYAPGVVFSIKGEAFDPAKFDSIRRDMETKLIPNLRHRRAAGGGHAEETPTEPGFCIENGFIADDGKTAQYEKAELNFRFKEWPDVTVVVRATRGGTKLKPSLLERVKNSKPIPDAFTEMAKKIKSFREGKQDVGPLQGEEILEAYPTDDGYFVHRFVWDTQGKLGSATEPAFYFQLHTGVNPGAGARQVRPSLTDKQAIELFDAIVNSIRLRPTGPAKTSAVEPTPSEDSSAAKRLPIGTKVSSNSHCPQTGIWQCAADAPGITQHRQFITAGKPMPYGVTQQAAKSVNGFFGRREDVTVDVAWTLIAYEKDAT